MDYRLKNVIILGTTFHLIFFSYQTALYIQQTVVKSLNSNTFNVNGYVTLFITYLSFAISNWLAPIILKRTGLKYGMFIGSLLYIPNVSMYLYPITSLFYSVPALTGIGAALIWNAQGSFLAKNSEPGKKGRDAAIFWSIFQTGLLLGSLFIYFEFNDETSISNLTRYLVYGVLTIVGTLGALSVLLLRSDHEHDQEIIELTPKTAYYLMKTPNMLLLSACFLFTGTFMSFISGIWGTAIAATTQFGSDANKYIGLSGIFLGIGETVGGAIFGFKFSERVRRDTIVLLGFLTTILALFLVFLNIPANASMTVDVNKFMPIIEPRVWIAMVTSTLMGFADACLNTQLYSLLMSVYSSQSVAAFGLFKFLQAFGSAIAYLYSTTLNLYYQVCILAVMCSISTMNFCLVEWRFRTQEEEIRE